MSGPRSDTSRKQGCIALKQNAIIAVLLLTLSLAQQLHWSAAAAAAVNCSDPGALSANGVRSGSTFTYNSMVTYTCMSGYRITGQDNSVTTLSVVCQANGAWNDSAPTCTGVGCGGPGNLTANGTRTGSTFTYPSTVTYTCNTGYRITGEDNAVTLQTWTCQASGAWTGTITPTCSPVRNVVMNAATSPTRVILFNDLTPVGHVLYRFMATDQGISTHHVTRFIIGTVDPEDAGSYFTLNATTGVLELSRQFDFDASTAHHNVTLSVIGLSEENVTVTLSDNMVLLQLTDANDNIPFLTDTPYTADVAESTAINTTVVQLKSADNDTSWPYSPRYSQTFVFPTVCSDMFKLDAISGNFTVDRELDYELDTRSCLFFVFVSDGEGLTSDRETVIINVSNSNDHAPIFKPGSEAISIPEDIADGTDILTATATDEDPLDNITYSLEPVEGFEYAFEVDDTSGVVTVNNSDFDYDVASQRVLFLKVIATDTELMEDVMNVTIDITQSIGFDSCTDESKNIATIASSSVLLLLVAALSVTLGLMGKDSVSCTTTALNAHGKLSVPDSTPSSHGTLPVAEKKPIFFNVTLPVADTAPSFEMYDVLAPALPPRRTSARIGSH